MFKKIRKKLKDIKFIYIPYRNIKIFIIDIFRNYYLKKSGYNLLNDVSKEIEKTDIKMFCAFGTLLGFIRDKGIIKHDLDIDMGILSDEEFDWNNLDKILINIGMEKSHQFRLDDGKIMERTYKRDNVSIDFFIYMKKSNYMYTYLYFDQIDEIKRSVRISKSPVIKNITYLSDIKVRVPVMSNSIEYIKSIYGENWQIPDPNFKHKEELLKERYAIVENL